MDEMERKLMEVLKLSKCIAPKQERKDELFSNLEGNRGFGNRKKRVLIWYVGGVTLAEVAALRFLNEK